MFLFPYNHTSCFVLTADSKEFEDVNNPAVTGLLGGDSGHGLSTVDESSDQLAGEIVNKPKKKGKAKGLGHVAESVEDMFIKVAVSESKLKAGDNKKEVGINWD